MEKDGYNLDLILVSENIRQQCAKTITAYNNGEYETLSTALKFKSRTNVLCCVGTFKKKKKTVAFAFFRVVTGLVRGVPYVKLNFIDIRVGSGGGREADEIGKREEEAEKKDI